MHIYYVFKLCLVIYSDIIFSFAKQLSVAVACEIEMLVMQHAQPERYSNNKIQPLYNLPNQERGIFSRKKNSRAPE